MRNFTSYWTSVLSCLVIFSLTSCEDDDAAVKEQSLPKILSFEAPEALITYQEATLTAEVENAKTVLYTYALEAEDLQEVSLWEEVEVSDSNTVEILLEDLERITPYKAAMLAVGKNGESKIATLVFTTDDVELKVSASAVSGTESYNKAQVKVSVVNATAFQWTYYVRDQRPNDNDIVWTEQETEEGQSEYLVDIDGLSPSADSRTIYTFEVKAKLDETVSEPAYANFQTLATLAVRMSNFNIGSFMAKYDVEIVKEFCDGYAYLLQNNDWYDVLNFTDGVTQWLPTITENGTYEADMMLLTPGTGYTFDVQPLKIDADSDTKELVGERITEQFTTPAFSLNQGADYAEVEVIEDEVKVSSIAINVNRSCENTTAFVAGAVSKADLGDTSLEDYINKTWYSDFVYPVSFTSMVGLMDQVRYDLTQLLPETEYIVFAIAIDADGRVGEIRSQDVSTKAIEYNEDAVIANLTIVPRFTDADITPVFGEGISSAFYAVAPKGDLSIEDAQKYLESESTNAYSSAMLWNESMTTLRDLTVDTQYDLYILAVDTEGALGKAVLYEFSTLELNYSSPASLEITVENITADEDVKEWINVDFNVELTNGATSYYKAVIDKNYFPQANPTAKQFADYALSNNLLTETFTEQTTSMTVYSKEYYALFIPVDANKEMGEPQIIKFTDYEWPDAEDGNEGDGGNTPK